MAYCQVFKNLVGKNMVDVVADMLSRINNAQTRKLVSVEIPYSSFKYNIAQVMLREGYIKSCNVEDVTGSIKSIVINLKYLRDGSAVIQEMKKISKSGRRIYRKISKLSEHYNSLGTIILSTSRGIISDSEARKAGIGGEIICKVF